MTAIAFPSVFRRLMVESITIKRFVQSGQDEYGRSDGTWQVVATVQARIASRGISEDRQNRESITQRRAAAVHPLTDVVHTDRVDYDGMEWEIETVEKVYSHRGLAYKRIVMVKEY